MRLLIVISVVIACAGCGEKSHDGEPLNATVTATPVAATIQGPPIRRSQVGSRPVEAIDRVIVISIDGLRPDLLLRAYMPHVRALCKRGSYSFWAETTPEAYTLPCHVSMLTGAPSQKHGVTWNNYIEESYPSVPTLFDVAKQAGYSTAMVTGKMKFIVFTKPGALDFSYLPPDEPVSDMHVAARAEKVMREHRPQVLFVHLPGVDTAGHDFGWGTTQQIKAIEEADTAVGLIIDTLNDLKLNESTLVILTSDHGGAAKGHKQDDPRSHFIPWIASGPGLRKDFDLTIHDDLRIRVEDTYATACEFLGIDPGEDCIGKPVTAIRPSD